jgi:hypothetical protein
MNFTAENHQYLAERLASVVAHKPPVRLRASSVGDLFDCPDRWIAVHIEGLRVAQNFRATMGTAIHAGTAHFDTEVLNGQMPSLMAATECTAETLRNSEEDTVWDMKRDQAESIAVALTHKYCTQESPKHHFTAVEKTCESLVLSDVGIELTGSVDRIREAGNRYGPADLKSGVQAVNSEGQAKTQAHAPQLGVYSLLGEVSTGKPMELPSLVIGMQTAKTRENQRIASTEVHGVREVLLGDDTRPGLLFNAALMIHGVIPPYGNPRSMLCHQKFCPRFNNCFWRK